MDALLNRRRKVGPQRRVSLSKLLRRQVAIDYYQLLVDERMTLSVSIKALGLDVAGTRQNRFEVFNRQTEFVRPFPLQDE